jgi:hypothetical protein
METAPDAEAGGGGAARTAAVDRGLPSGANYEVVDEYHTKLMQTNIGGGDNNNKFYIIQVVANGRHEVAHLQHIIASAYHTCTHHLYTPHLYTLHHTCTCHIYT